MSYRIPKCHPDRKYYAKDRCRSCYRKYTYHENPTPYIFRTKKYREENPDKAKAIDFAKNLKANYGLTVEQYNTLVTNQDGKCNICGVLLEVPLVDHCHKTGKVRALLCRPCNSGLGMFRDDLTLLRRATDYLVQHAQL